MVEISFVVFPCLTKFAVWTSEGVNFTCLVANLTEKEAVISFMFSSITKDEVR